MPLKGEIFLLKCLCEWNHFICQILIIITSFDAEISDNMKCIPGNQTIKLLFLLTFAWKLTKFFSAGCLWEFQPFLMLVAPEISIPFCCWLPCQSQPCWCWLPCLLLVTLRITAFFLLVTPENSSLVFCWLPLSGSFPVFFLPIATTSNKIFKSEVIGNWKCRCCEFRGEGQ